MGSDEGLEPPFHDDKNGIFQLSLCYHLHQSLLLSELARTSSLCILHLIYNIRGLPTPAILDGGLAWP